MKKALTASLLTAEIVAFVMLLALFFVNTNKPYLLLVPIIMGVGGYFAFAAPLRKVREKNDRKATVLMVVMPIALGSLIAASVIGLVYLL